MKLYLAAVALAAPVASAQACPLRTHMVCTYTPNGPVNCHEEFEPGSCPEADSQNRINGNRR